MVPPSFFLAAIPDAPDDALPGIVDLKGDAAANFLSHIYDTCHRVSPLTRYTSRGVVKGLPYREIVKLTQRFEGVPAAVILSVHESPDPGILGQGSYGRVLLGTFQSQDVAIKVPNRRCSRKAILKEFAFGFLLCHPHVLRSLGIIDTPLPRIITSRMINGHIGEYLRVSDSGLKDMCRLVTEIADALAYMHGLKIVHGDLRVPNILIDSGGHVRIGDFGKSGFDGSTAPSSGGELIGAAGYLAPELVDPEAFELPDPVRPSLRSDMFAFGSTVYEIFEGKPPFSRLNNVQIAVRISHRKRCSRPRAIPEGLWELISCCWEHDPSTRPDAETVHDRSRTLVGGA